MNNTNLENTLKALRLSGLCQTLGVRLQEAAANRLGHAEFLELICQDEINVRKERLMGRRTKAADFHSLKTLEDFDWSFNPSIHKKDIFDLATCNFIRQAKDALFIGPPGVGKTHLAQAIGYEAIRQDFQVLYRSIFDLVRDFMKDEAFNQQDKTLRKYLKPELVIIDDMGLKQLPKHSGCAHRRRDLRPFSPSRPSHRHYRQKLPNQRSPAGQPSQKARQIQSDAFDRRGRELRLDSSAPARLFGSQQTHDTQKKII